MPLKFHCVCGQTLIVSRRLIGRSVRCPKCDVKVKVPGPRVASDHAAATPAPVERTLPPAPSRAPTPAVSPDVVSEEIPTGDSSAAVVRGYEPDPRDVSAAQWLAMGIIFTALFGIIPAVLDVAAHLRVESSTHVAVWAYLSIFLAVVEIGYAFYLVQLPDWSSVWVTTLVTLAVSVGYAMLLGLTYISRPDGWLARGLDLSEHLAGGRAAGWCFVMLCSTSLMSYLSGRLSMRWYAA